MTFYVQYCFLGSCFSTALFYKAFFFSEVTTVTAQLNKTNRGPLGFCRLMWKNYIWVHVSLQKLYLRKQVVQGSARLVCFYRVLCVPCGHTSAHLQGVRSKCLILCMQHTPTHSHTHTDIHIYVKRYICMHVHINILNSCPYSPI